MAVLTPTRIAITGSAESYVSAAGGGDTITNTGANPVYLRAKNASGSPITVTADSIVPCEYGFDHNAVVVVPASGGIRDIGPLPASQFGTSVSISYSGVTSLTVYAWTT